jgi:hypothetical protein
MAKTLHHHSAYAKLFRPHTSEAMDLQQNEALSFIDAELRIWQRDIHQLYARLSTGLNRSERLHCQAVLLTFSSIREHKHGWIPRYAMILTALLIEQV